MGAHDGNGWHLGVTNCHNSNKLSDNIGGKTSKYSWRMDFAIPNYGIASAIRHKGTNHNDHGYDHAKNWPAGASAITSSVHKNDGEMTSAYKDASGKWQWFAKYNVGGFDIKSNKAASAPYFTFMYSGGGPGNCDEKNSDGFDTKDWEIYGLFTHPRQAPAKGCYALSQQTPKPPNGVYTLVAKDGGLYDAYCDISGGGGTRVYSNTFFSNHHGITYNIDCPCGPNAGMNNGAKALDGNGWHLGVTNCHNSNKLSGTIGGKSTTYSWRMDFAIPNYGIAAAIRHKGINHNDHGYDHQKSWPAGAAAISSNVHKKD